MEYFLKNRLCKYNRPHLTGEIVKHIPNIFNIDVFDIDIITYINRYCKLNGLIHLHFHNYH